jgi:hypothetical protein
MGVQPAPPCPPPPQGPLHSHRLLTIDGRVHQPVNQERRSGPRGDLMDRRNPFPERRIHAKAKESRLGVEGSTVSRCHGIIVAGQADETKALGMALRQDRSEDRTRRRAGNHVSMRVNAVGVTLLSQPRNRVFRILKRNIGISSLLDKAILGSHAHDTPTGQVARLRTTAVGCASNKATSMKPDHGHARNGILGTIHVHKQRPFTRPFELHLARGERGGAPGSTPPTGVASRIQVTVENSAHPA